MPLNLTMHRRYLLADQLRFAELSGDRNPIHVCPEHARRLLFGEPVVHGMHLVLWALDELAKYCAPGKQIFSVRATFGKPAFLNEDVGASITTIGDLANLKLWSNAEMIIELSVEFGMAEFTRNVPDKIVELDRCLDLSRASIRSAAGKTVLALPRDLANSLFPSCLKILSPRLLASLLASTRIVGMQCPGEHSILHGFSLQLDSGEGAGELSYSVQSFDDRFGLVRCFVSAGDISGVLESFLRPAAVRQESLSEVKAKVSAREFAKQHALVIGGSRGIGETIAKAILAGGGTASITFYRGQLDADRIRAECRLAGLLLEAVHYDALDPAAIIPEFSRPYTHIYYCATPKIRPSKPRDGDFQLLHQYTEYFVEAARRSFTFALRRSVENAVLFYPSTMFLDSRPRRFKDYCDAKAAGEAMCMELQATYPKVRVMMPRLPAMATDQTQSLTAMSLQSTLTTMLPFLRDAAIATA